jgi:hypothetical protein
MVLTTALVAFPGAAFGQPDATVQGEPPGEPESSGDAEPSGGGTPGAVGVASTSTASESGTSGAANATAARPRDESPDFDLSFSSQTYLQVYQRALLPGPGGASVDTALLAPAHEYIYLRADRVDTPWAADSIGFELSAWAASQLAGDELGSNPDGDVTIANVYHRVGPATFRLGRQVQTAGAARFVRFDGLAADVVTSSGIGATAYGGFTVLPRWNARPSYHHLGSAFDTLVDSPEGLPEPSRSGDWLVGGRFGYTMDWLTAGVGVHEQRTGSELDRRNAAVDLRLSPADELDLTTRVIADLDALAVADASAAADLYPIEPLHLALEYRRVTPSLLLSKQSVFSVFSTERFDEAGGEVGYEATDRFEVGAGQWVELLGLGDVAHPPPGVTTVRPAARLWAGLGTGQRLPFDASLRALAGGSSRFDRGRTLRVRLRRENQRLRAVLDRGAQRTVRWVVAPSLPLRGHIGSYALRGLRRPGVVACRLPA